MVAAFVEHDLKRADPQDQKGETDLVDYRARRGIGLATQEVEHGQAAGCRYRHLDEEDPLPAQVVDEHALGLGQIANGDVIEIWLDGEKIVDSSDAMVVEPIYGQHYLPRKFKICVIASPEDRAAMRLHDIGLELVKKDGVVGARGAPA